MIGHDESTFLGALQRLLAADPKVGLTQCLDAFVGHEETVARIWLAAHTGRTPSPPAAAVSDLVGPYERLCVLGRGAQAEVWQARDTRTDRIVALKMLIGVPTEQAVQRLRREAQAIARLRNPAVAEVLDADLDHRPAWLAVRHVEGVTLRSALDGAGVAHADHAADRLVAQCDRPMPIAALRYFEAVARALHEVHEARVVHADLHPGNLMVTVAGAPVILDFGAAKLLDGPSITRSEIALGSARYAAPEVLRGRRGDRRSDVFALAAILLDCATWRREERRDRLVPPADLPSDLRIVLAKALQPQPQDRFASAAAFADELRRIRAGEPVRTGNDWRVRQVVHAVVSNPWPAAAAIVLAVLFALAVVAWHAAATAQKAAAAATQRGRALIGHFASEAAAAGKPGQVLVHTLAGSTTAADGAFTGNLELEVGRLLRRAGNLVEAEPHLATAWQLLIAAGDRDTADRAAFEAALNCHDLGLPLTPVGDDAGHGSASAGFVRGLRALHDGDPATAWTCLSQAVQDPSWPDPADRAEAAWIAAHLLIDDGEIEAAARLLAAIDAPPGPSHTVTRLLQGRVLFARGQVDSATAAIRAASAELAWRLGDNHPWTLRGDRAMACCIAAAGELSRATALFMSLRRRQAFLHGATHPEPVLSLLLERDARLRAGDAAGVDANDRELQELPPVPATRRWLARPRATVPASFVRPAGIPRQDRVRRLEEAFAEADREKRRLQAEAAAGKVAWDQSVAHILDVWHPAHIAMMRARSGDASDDYIGAVLILVNDQLMHGATRAAFRSVREAVRAMRTAPIGAISRPTQLMVSSRWIKIQHEERNFGLANPTVRLDQMDAWQQLIAEARTMLGERDERFLTMAKDFADVAAGCPPALAREAAAIYQLWCDHDGTDLARYQWLASAQIQAEMADEAERTMATLRARLGPRPEPASAHWLWPHVDALEQRLTALRARLASPRIGR